MPIVNASIASNVTIHHPDLVNIYGCTIGKGTRIGSFVEVQKNARIGENCKISSHTFVCEGVKIGNGVFIGHGVMFINDLLPRATNPDGKPQNEKDWNIVTTEVENDVSIGTGVVVLGGITIGYGAFIGAGAVVTKNVAPETTVTGVPARLHAMTRKHHEE